MATGSSGLRSSSPSGYSRPTHEDFRPKSEWHEEASAHIVKVYLPGFRKEQIRVTYDERSRSFNVRGERPLGRDRFSRVNVDFSVPENCKITEMQGKFQEDVLTIAIPKLVVTPVIPSPSTTDDAPNKEATVARTGPQALTPPEAAAAAAHVAAKQPGKQTDDERGFMPQKGEPKPSEPKPSPSQNGSRNETRDTSVLLPDPERKLGRTREDDKDVQGMYKDGLRPNKDFVVKSGPEEIRRLDDEATTGKKKKKKMEQEKKKDVEAQTRRGSGEDEERQLMLNVGAAALVLVAFGAFIAYNICCPRSSGKE